MLNSHVNSLNHRISSCNNQTRIDYGKMTNGISRWVDFLTDFWNLRINSGSNGIGGDGVSNSGSITEHGDQMGNGRSSRVSTASEAASEMDPEEPFGQEASRR